jgi:hypothetical protein
MSVLEGRRSFSCYVGIDYSGAETADASLKGLRVYMAQANAPAEEVLPPPSPRKYWTRRGIAHWLEERLAEDVPTLVGIDHSFSFPLRYFETHHLPPDWPAFLDDFQQYWPTDGEHVYVDFIRDGHLGNGAARTGNPRWRDSPRSAAAPSRCSISTSRAPSPNPPTPAFPGCATCVASSATGCTSGPSTAGTFRRAARLSRRPIPRSGNTSTHGRTAPPTSTTPTLPPLGSAPPTATAAWPRHSIRISHHRSVRWQRWRGGFWGGVNFELPWRTVQACGAGWNDDRDL